MQPAELSLYSGFFLAQLPGKHNGRNLIKIACFKAGTDFRRVLELTTDQDCIQKYGSIIHFCVLDEDLKDKSLVKPIEIKEVTLSHEESMTDRIVHTVKKFSVGPENLPSLNVFKHPDLGIIKDEGSVMKTGTFNFITFEVLLQDDTFEIKTVGGQHLPETKEKLEKSNDVDFSLIPEVLKIEHEHNKMAETELWNKIGCLKLVGYDEKEITSGLRPVFQLCDQKNVQLFSKCKNTAPVRMIKLHEVDGEQVDDPNAKHQIGSIFPRIKIERKNKEGVVCPSREIENEAVVQLKSEYRHRFEHAFSIGNYFRFESELTLNNYLFWKNEKYKESEIYNYTIEGEQEPNELKMQDILDCHRTDPEEFKNGENDKYKDKSTTKADLNETQLAAMKMALNDNRKLVCIQGPPGTGKSHVLSILLYKLMKANKQAVVLTPTKEALKSLRAMTDQVIKKRGLGKDLHEHALMDITYYNSILNGSPEAIAATEQIRVWKSQAKDGNITLDDYQELKNNRTRELKFLGYKILENARIVFGTMESSFIITAMKNKKFNPCMCIIDEAAQVMESATWPAVEQMKRIVMAGDPKQLPALVKTEEARNAKLERSVMERILSQKDHYSWIMLQEQYRCHKDITDWSNGCFYNCELKNCTAAEDTLHRDLNPKPPKEYQRLFNPLVFVDTSLQTDPEKRVKTYERKADSKEILKRDGKDEAVSFCNEGEAEIAIKHYGRLLSMGIKPQNVAIITPYKGQIDVLKKLMNEYSQTLETPAITHLTTIGTVDSVQGQEYDCVIFSMVRSNPQKKIGFVSDKRRMNVVITRAKRHFMLIANAYMIASSVVPEIRKLYDIIQSKGQRFHPNNVYGEHGPVTPDVSNNFGQDFRPFIENSNDAEMKKWCVEFVERGKDPIFRAKQAEKRFARDQVNGNRDRKQ